MFNKHPRALLSAAAVASTFGAASLFAAPAMADCSVTAPSTGCLTTVSGTALGSLSLAVATPAAMVLTPGATPTLTGLVNESTSAVTALDTSSATPSISVKDAASSNAGYMKLVSATGCSSSTTEAKLNHPLNVSDITSVVGWTDAGHLPSDLSGTAVTLASSNLPVPTGAFTVTFKQPVDSTETLLNPCVYQLTATYTLQ